VLVERGRECLGDLLSADLAEQQDPDIEVASDALTGARTRQSEADECTWAEALVRCSA
jgi:hypothetical protein